MTPSHATGLLHIVGFLTASALYIMLAAMTVGSHARESSPAAAKRWRANRSDLIPLATALLGLAWNAGALVMYGLHATDAPRPGWLAVAAFGALSFLPAVVVHASLAGATGASAARSHAEARALVLVAYGLSVAATLINLGAALGHNPVPSRTATVVLGLGFATVVGLLTAYSRRQPAWRRALPAAGVAAFAVMLVHLTQHSATADPWAIEIIGHHGSLLVVLVILYQDYRFAFADLFLKRAMTLLALTGMAAALYAWIFVPLVLPRLAGSVAPASDSLAAAALLGMWIGTAIAYPRLRDIVGRFVDRIVLRRPDTHRLLADLVATVATLNTAEPVLDAVCDTLAPALSATRVAWRIATSLDPPNEADGVSPAGSMAPRALQARVPTTDPPGYIIVIGPLTGGRRILSDDQQFLERVVRLAGRRIDTIRVAHERWERDVREQQILHLATEAELRALRAQLNPHFLFNALTTIGYLVRESPDRALDTLLRLTDVLRAVLKRSDGEFTTLGEEMEIVSAYLSIERTRFEDRLGVTIDVPPELASVRIPPLLLQPVVENAVKHGIGPVSRGGCVTIRARTERRPMQAVGREANTADTLCLTVTDTGIGASMAEFTKRPRVGIGLANIERRLEKYFGAAASVEIRSAIGVGTTVELRLPALVREARLTA